MSDSESDFEAPKFTSTQMSPKKINMDKDKFAGQLRGMNINSLMKTKILAALGKQKEGILKHVKHDDNDSKESKGFEYDDELDSSYHSDTKAPRKLSSSEMKKQVLRSSVKFQIDKKSKSSEKSKKRKSSESEDSSEASIKNKKIVSPPKKVLKQNNTISSSSSEESDNDIKTSINRKKEENTNKSKSPKVKIVSNMLISKPTPERQLEKISDSSSGSSSKGDSSSSDSGSGSNSESSSTEDDEKKPEPNKSLKQSKEESSVAKSKSPTKNSSRSSSSASSKSGSSSSDSASSTSSGSSSGSSSSEDSSSEDEDKSKHKESSYQSKGGLVSSNDDSDSSVDEPTVMDESLIKATKHRNKLLENYVQMNTLETLKFADQFNLKDIHADCEVFTVKISKDLDPQCLLNQNVTFERKQQLKVDNKHLLIEYDKDDKNTLCLLRPKHKELGIVHLRTKGSLCINNNMIIDVPPIMEFKKTVEKQTVAFPTAKLKPRHPIFGKSYEKRIELEPDIAKRLEKLIKEKSKQYEEDSPPDSKEKTSKIEKKKKHKRKSDTVETLDETTPKKKKKKHKELQIESIMESFNLDIQKEEVPPIVVKKKKEKKKKHDEVDLSIYKSNEVQNSEIQDKSHEKPKKEKKSKKDKEKSDKSVVDKSNSKVDLQTSNIIDENSEKHHSKKKKKKEKKRDSESPEKNFISPPTILHNKHLNKVFNSTMCSPSVNKTIFDANESAIGKPKVKKSKSKSQEKIEIMKFIDETITKSNKDHSDGSEVKSKKKRRHSVTFEVPEVPASTDNVEKIKAKIKKRRPTVV